MEMREAIPPGSKVLIVPYWNSSPFAVAVRYGLWAFETPARRIDATIMWDPQDFPKAASWAARGEADYLVIQDGEGDMDEAAASIGLPRLNRELALFRWHDGAWRKVKSWPVPPDVVRRD